MEIRKVRYVIYIIVAFAILISLFLSSAHPAEKDDRQYMVWEQETFSGKIKISDGKFDMKTLKYTSYKWVDNYSLVLKWEKFVDVFENLKSCKQSIKKYIKVHNYKIIEDKPYYIKIVIMVNKPDIQGRVIRKYHCFPVGMGPRR